MENLTIENLRENLEKTLNDLNIIRKFCQINNISLIIKSVNTFSDFFYNESSSDLCIRKLEEVITKKL